MASSVFSQVNPNASLPCFQIIYSLNFYPQPFFTCLVSLASSVSLPFASFTPFPDQICLGETLRFRNIFFSIQDPINRKDSHLKIIYRVAVATFFVKNPDDSAVCLLNWKVLSSSLTLILLVKIVSFLQFHSIAGRKF